MLQQTPFAGDSGVCDAFFGHFDNHISRNHHSKPCAANPPYYEGAASSSANPSTVCECICPSYLCVAAPLRLNTSTIEPLCASLVISVTWSNRAVIILLAFSQNKKTPWEGAAPPEPLRNPWRHVSFRVSRSHSALFQRCMM